MSYNARIALSVLIILFALIQSRAQAYFSTDESISKSYELITQLRLDEATVLLQEYRKTNPKNLMPELMDNYIDFFRIFIHEEEEELERLEKNKSLRLEKIKKGPKDSPYYRQTQAEILLQWALARIKFEEYYTAMLETRKAHNLLLENQLLFPDHKPNNKGLAMIHAIIGTIPDNYKYLVKLLTGLNGSIDASLQEIDELLAYSQQNEYLFEKEVHLIHSLIMLHLNNNKSKAWEIISIAGLTPEKSPAEAFILANIARHCGKTDEAIKILESKPSGEEYLDFVYLDFILGLNKINRLDKDADIHFNNFVQSFSGRNYIKEAYQKLAWHSHVIENDQKKAKEYYKKVIEEGYLFMDEDQSAYIEAKENILPDKQLLKARLLFDGAYYTKSAQLLEENKVYLKQEYTLEYTYRLARNYQMLKDPAKAINSYMQLIDLPESKDTYQQCNAALQIAIIYESLNNISLAKKFYEIALTMSPKKYERSLHQKAKAGLNRLKGKN